jgi:hypothetical protein
MVLTAALSKSPSAPLPGVIRLADRCWCDVSSSRLFEPFDIARWERKSVEQLKEEVERDAERVVQLLSSEGQMGSLDELDSNPSVINGTGSIVESQLSVSHLSSHTSILSTSPEPSSTPASGKQSSAPQIPAVPLPFNGPPVVASVNLPLLRRKYDLRPYGFSMVLDFGWSRED